MSIQGHAYESLAMWRVYGRGVLCVSAFVVMPRIAWVRRQRAGANPGGPPGGRSSLDPPQVVPGSPGFRGLLWIPGYKAVFAGSPAVCGPSLDPGTENGSSLDPGTENGPSLDPGTKNGPPQIPNFKGLGL